MGASTGLKLAIVLGSAFAIKSYSQSAYDSLIKKYAGQWNIEPALVKAIIRKESNFNPKARNWTAKEDSRGLGQINVYAHDYFDQNRLYEPEYNIISMCRILYNLKSKYPSTLQLISAYNAGSPTASNTAYTMEVFAYYIIYTIANYSIL